MRVYENRKTKFHEVYVKYGHLVDFIRLDPAEIRRLVGQNPLAVSACTGVFVLVVCAIKHSATGHGRQPSMILI